jgi:hypothetical protein
MMALWVLHVAMRLLAGRRGATYALTDPMKLNARFIAIRTYVCAMLDQLGLTRTDLENG